MNIADIDGKRVREGGSASFEADGVYIGNVVTDDAHLCSCDLKSGTGGSKVTEKGHGASNRMVFFIVVKSFLRIYIIKPYRAIAHCYMWKGDEGGSSTLASNPM